MPSNQKPARTVATLTKQAKKSRLLDGLAALGAIVGLGVAANTAAVSMLVEDGWAAPALDVVIGLVGGVAAAVLVYVLVLGGTFVACFRLGLVLRLVKALRR